MANQRNQSIPENVEPNPKTAEPGPETVEPSPETVEPSPEIVDCRRYCEAKPQNRKTHGPSNVWLKRLLTPWTFISSLTAQPGWKSKRHSTTMAARRQRKPSLLLPARQCSPKPKATDRRPGMCQERPRQRQRASGAVNVQRGDRCARGNKSK